MSGGYTVCRECGRVFDLADETDADEWYWGHDCEDEGDRCSCGHFPVSHGGGAGDLCDDCPGGACAGSVVRR